SVCIDILPLPSAAASKLPISPLWYPSASPHFPCLACVGFHCPPAEVASSALQSAFSCRCIACVPGFNPANLASKVTVPSSSEKYASPFTELPLLDSIATDRVLAGSF